MRVLFRVAGRAAEASNRSILVLMASRRNQGKIHAPLPRLSRDTKLSASAVCALDSTFLTAT